MKLKQFTHISRACSALRVLYGSHTSCAPEAVAAVAAEENGWKKRGWVRCFIRDRKRGGKHGLTVDYPHNVGNPPTHHLEDKPHFTLA